MRYVLCLLKKGQLWSRELNAVRNCMNEGKNELYMVFQNIVLLSRDWLGNDRFLLWWFLPTGEWTQPLQSQYTTSLSVILAQHVIPNSKLRSCFWFHIWHHFSMEASSDSLCRSSKPVVPKLFSNYLKTMLHFASHSSHWLLWWLQCSLACSRLF